MTHQTYAKNRHVQKQKRNGGGDAVTSRKKSVKEWMQIQSGGFKKNISGRMAKSKNNRTTFDSLAKSPNSLPSKSDFQIIDRNDGPSFADTVVMRHHEKLFTVVSTFQTPKITIIFSYASCGFVSI
jgi:hypothetical protein